MLCKGHCSSNFLWHDIIEFIGIKCWLKMAIRSVRQGSFHKKEGSWLAFSCAERNVPGWGTNFSWTRSKLCSNTCRIHRGSRPWYPGLTNTSGPTCPAIDPQRMVFICLKASIPWRWRQAALIPNPFWYAPVPCTWLPGSSRLHLVGFNTTRMALLLRNKVLTKGQRGTL